MSERDKRIELKQIDAKTLDAAHKALQKQITVATDLLKNNPDLVAKLLEKEIMKNVVTSLPLHSVDCLSGGKEAHNCAELVNFNCGVAKAGFTCLSRTMFTCTGSGFDDYECLREFKCPTRFICNFSFDNEDCESKFHCEGRSGGPFHCTAEFNNW